MRGKTNDTAAGRLEVGSSSVSRLPTMSPEQLAEARNHVEEKRVKYESESNGNSSSITKTTRARPAPQKALKENVSAKRKTATAYTSESIFGVGKPSENKYNI